MPEPDVRRSSISNSTSLKEMGEYWDTHDLPDDCADATEQLEVCIEAEQHLVAVDPDVLREAVDAARKRGISVQTFVNLAIRQAVELKG